MTNVRWRWWRIGWINCCCRFRMWILLWKISRMMMEKSLSSSYGGWSINWNSRYRLWLVILIKKLPDRTLLLPRKVNIWILFGFANCEILGLLQKLDKCIEALIKKMADKNDTKKALLFLEKRINDLQQLSFERKQTSEDDPLIAKRPLFWSCVSCDIDVDKVSI